MQTTAKVELITERLTTLMVNLNARLLAAYQDHNIPAETQSEISSVCVPLLEAIIDLRTEVLGELDEENLIPV